MSHFITLYVFHVCNIGANLVDRTIPVVFRTVGRGVVSTTHYPCGGPSVVKDIAALNVQSEEETYVDSGEETFYYLPKYESCVERDSS